MKIELKDNVSVQIYTLNGCVTFEADAGVADAPQLVAEHLIASGLATVPRPVPAPAKLKHNGGEA